LKTCEFCTGFPLVCLSGVTGANLKKRIVHIMTQGVPCKLDFSKRLLIGAAGLVAIAVPILFGLLKATPGRAESQIGNPGGRTHALDPLHPNRDKPAGKAVLPVTMVVSPIATACRKSVRAPKPVSSGRGDPARER